jgi:predicted nuclease of predicted toxin-antitoxin system
VNSSRILADESVAQPVVHSLLQDGLDVLAIADTSPGIPDAQVLEIANREGRILVTMDKDFGELVFRERRLSTGVVLLRLPGLTSEAKSHIVLEVFRQYGDELAGCFTVVTQRNVRIRKP